MFQGDEQNKVILRKGGVDYYMVYFRGKGEDPGKKMGGSGRKGDHMLWVSQTETETNLTA